jgi:hypothetical protein
VKDGVIVAHAGIWPITFGKGPDALRGVQMIDWASDKKSPGAGIALVRMFAETFDFIYSIGGSEMTRKILPVFGFVEYASQWRAVRPLRPVRQILTHQTRNWKLAPRLVRNWMWSRPKAQSPHPTWSAAPIAPGEISPDLYTAAMADASFSMRPPAFFEYLLRSPVARFSLYAIVDGSTPIGHFALSLLHGQARVAGIWVRHPGRDAWTAAYLLAQQTARRTGGNEIVAAGCDGPARDAAIQSGFRILPGTPVFLLNKQQRLRLSPGFQLQLSDSDAAFLDGGSAEYWT